MEGKSSSSSLGKPKTIITVILAVGACAVTVVIILYVKYNLSGDIQITKTTSSTPLRPASDATPAKGLEINILNSDLVELNAKDVTKKKTEEKGKKDEKEKEKKDEKEKEKKDEKEKEKKDEKEKELMREIFRLLDKLVQDGKLNMLLVPLTKEEATIPALHNILEKISATEPEVAKSLLQLYTKIHSGDAKTLKEIEQVSTLEKAKKIALDVFSECFKALDRGATIFYGMNSSNMVNKEIHRVKSATDFKNILSAFMNCQKFLLCTEKKKTVLMAVQFSILGVYYEGEGEVKVAAAFNALAEIFKKNDIDEKQSEKMQEWLTVLLNVKEMKLLRTLPFMTDDDYTRQELKHRGFYPQTLISEEGKDELEIIRAAKPETTLLFLKANDKNDCKSRLQTFDCDFKNCTEIAKFFKVLAILFHEAAKSEISNLIKRTENFFAAGKETEHKQILQLLRAISGRCAKEALPKNVTVSQKLLLRTSILIYDLFDSGQEEVENQVFFGLLVEPRKDADYLAAFAAYKALRSENSAATLAAFLKSVYKIDPALLAKVGVFCQPIHSTSNCLLFETIPGITSDLDKVGENLYQLEQAPTNSDIVWDTRAFYQFPLLINALDADILLGAYRLIAPKTELPADLSFKTNPAFVTFEKEVKSFIDEFDDARPNRALMESNEEGDNFYVCYEKLPAPSVLPSIAFLKCMPKGKMEKKIESLVEAYEKLAGVMDPKIAGLMAAESVALKKALALS